MTPPAQYVAVSTPPKIDPAQIPEVEARNLCRDLLTAVQRFYQNPENLKQFEEWEAAQGGSYA